MKKEALQQKVKELVVNLLQNKEVSQNKLAEMIGISPATLTNLLKERWEKFNESMLIKIYSYFTPNNWNLVETTNFETIYCRCDEARNKKSLIALIGYAGAGKTATIRNYYENNPDTYLVTCAKNMRTKQFLSEILKSLGVSYLASDFEMTKTIIEELNKKQAPLLIIDEASKLSSTHLMYIQDIWDGIEPNCGLILAGVDYLLTNVKKQAEKNKIGMPEFYSRVSMWQYLSPPTKEEIKSICIANGIEDKNALQAICKLKNFREVKHAIKNLKTI